MKQLIFTKLPRSPHPSEDSEVLKRGAKLAAYVYRFYEFKTTLRER